MFLIQEVRNLSVICENELLTVLTMKVTLRMMMRILLWEKMMVEMLSVTSVSMSMICMKCMLVRAEFFFVMGMLVILVEEEED